MTTGISLLPAAAQATALRVTYPAYAPTLTFDLDQFDMAVVTLTGNLTVAFINGHDGQIFRVRLKQDATGGRVLTLGGGVRLGSDISALLNSLGANYTDYFAVAFNATDTKYDVVALARGFH